MDEKSKIEPKVVTQIGFIVNNIEETTRSFADFFGVEVPEIVWTGEFEDAQQHYKGEPIESRAKQSFFEMENIQLELIEPDEGPSTWRDHLEEHGEGLHHIAFVVDDMKQTVKKMEGLNIPVIQKGEYQGGRYAYLDSFDRLKVILELLEND